MICDLICIGRKYVKHNSLSLIINFIFFWYCVVVLYTNYVNFKPAYPFMKDAGVILMAIVFIISLVLINLSYYLQLFLVKMINNNKDNDNDVILKKII
jgi:hypothetical protein